MLSTCPNHTVWRRDLRHLLEESEVTLIDRQHQHGAILEAIPALARGFGRQKADMATAPMPAIPFDTKDEFGTVQSRGATCWLYRSFYSRVPDMRVETLEER